MKEKLISYKCKECGKEFTSINRLSYHLRVHNIKPIDYYIKYIGPRGTCVSCGKPTTFASLKKGFLHYCSLKCSNSSSSVKEKKRMTCFQNYGVFVPIFNDCVKEKMEETCLRKYGVKNASQSEEIKEKKRITTNKHFGVDCPFQSPIIKKTSIKNNLSKYGVPYPNQSLLVQTKRRKKFILKLLQSGRLQNIIPNFNIDNYEHISITYSWICVKCGNNFESNLDNGCIPKCPICYPKIIGVSQAEKEVSEFVKSFGIEIIENDRSILKGKELDIYIPSHNLAIEFDGLYWHSDLNGVDKYYHLNKTIECQKQGIQLIHIFEDEWIDKQEIVKSIIRSKLGLCKRIYARNCIFSKVNTLEAKLFLVDNHLQGAINGKHYGLYYDGALMLLMTLGKSRFDKHDKWEIFRFCSKMNFHIVGGFSKSLNHVNKYHNWNTLITYADRRYGEGQVYSKCGFMFDKSTLPSYYYLKDCRKHNRLEFQKHLLESKLETFDPDLTEWENMQLNGYDRIWDCGCNVYVQKREVETT